MRKLSEINEGFWKDGIKRAKSGEKRIGERMISNIKDMVAVDIGMKFEIANIDLEVAGEELITWPHLYEIYDQILKCGWRLPTTEEMNKLSNKFNFCAEKIDGDNKLIYIQPKRNQTKDIKVDMCVLDKNNQDSYIKYWYEPLKGMREEYESVSPFKDNKDWVHRIFVVQIFLRWGTLRATGQIFPDEPETQKCRVRLVRDRLKTRK